MNKFLFIPTGAFNHTGTPPRCIFTCDIDLKITIICCIIGVIFLTYILIKEIINDGKIDKKERRR